jgi:hypothetical protein
MFDYLSGRIRKTPSNKVSPDRYKWLHPSQVEPDMGLPTANGSFFTSGIDGTRFWSDTITVDGNVATIQNLTVSNTINLGDISNIKITGGSNGQSIITDGTGNLSWANIVGGNTTQIQFNDSGVLNGSDTFTFDKDTGAVIVTNDLTANSLTIGSGVYKFSRTSMFHATTISTATQQIVALDAENLAGVDLTIISTDAVANSRQITKLSVVIYDGNVSYNDTSTIAVNNYLVEFSVNYDSDNSKLQINVSPSTANFMNHKMQITAYDE